MQKLIELANRIEDGELRKKVVDYIKDPTPSHKDFKKYPKGEWEKIKTYFSVGGLPVERDVLKHTIAVTELCLDVAKTVEKNFGTKVNKDVLVAGALLHDVMKLLEWKMTSAGPEHTGVMLDHSFLGVAELYRREFPEEVIHMIASHFGETGPTPPRTLEAYILNQVDSMLSMIEYNANVKTKQSQMVLLDEEMIKKLAGKKEE